MQRIILKRSDCRRETFRAGGKGGQHQNKTESAVRYVHEPTGIRAEARSERSQKQNDGVAWSLLQAKLDRYVEDKQAAMAAETYAAKPEASFGHQIRSYFLAGERRVVDHVTGLKACVDAVLRRGHLQPLIDARLRMRQSTRGSQDRHEH